MSPVSRAKSDQRMWDIITGEKSKQKGEGVKDR